MNEVIDDWETICSLSIPLVTHSTKFDKASYVKLVMQVAKTEDVPKTLYSLKELYFND